MTSLLFDTARRLVEAQGFGARSASVGLVVVLTLAGLLIGAEVLRALGGARARALRANLTIAIVPLMLAFAVILGTRFGHLV